MASNSLLESYIHVIYENRKKLEKTFSKNIFSTRPKFSNLKIFVFFSNIFGFSFFDFFKSQKKMKIKKWNPKLKKKNQKSKNQNFWDLKILVWSKKYFSKKFFPTFFNFHKLHEYSFLISYWTPPNSFWSRRTSYFNLPDPIFCRENRAHPLAALRVFWIGLRKICWKSANVSNFGELVLRDEESNRKKSKNVWAYRPKGPEKRV